MTIPIMPNIPACTGRRLRQVRVRFVPVGAVLDVSLRGRNNWLSLSHIDHTHGDSAMNWGFIARFDDWFQSLLRSTWNWFNSLDYQEWFLLLGIVAVLGFLCMRGFGSRSKM